MSEIPKGPQFVGQADARKLRTEAVKPAEVKLSPEQQRVAEVIKESGEALEKKVIDASEKAGEQLKKLQGKALVDAGMKQIGYGAWETIKGQFFGALRGGVVGGVIGAVGGERMRGINLDLLDIGRPRTDHLPVSTYSNTSIGAGAGINIGMIAGYEAAGLRYNKKIAPERNLPKTEWYDWVTGNASLLGLGVLANGRISGRAGTVAIRVASLFANPISMGGLRNVATGLWHMRKG